MRGRATGTARTAPGLGACVAGTLLVVAACGSGTDQARPEGFEATPAFLRTVATTSASEAFRFEAWISFDGDAVPDRAPVIAGEHRDGNVAMYTDVAAICEVLLDALDEEPPDDSPLPDLLDEADFTLESIYMDGPEHLYLRVPFLEDLADDDLEPLDRKIKELVAATDGWMAVDFTQVTVLTPADLTRAMSAGQGEDPIAMADMVAVAASAEEIGTQEIHDEATVGIAADVAMSDLMQAEGRDRDEYRKQTTEVPPDIVDAMPDDAREEIERAAAFRGVWFDAMVAMTVPIEVWIDAEGYARRVGYTVDIGDALARAADTAADLDDEDIAELEELAAETGDLAMTVTMDFFDFGDPTIDVQPPANAADVTHHLDLLAGNRLAELSAEADRLAAELDRLAADLEVLAQWETEWDPSAPHLPDAYIPPDDILYEPPPLPPVPEYEPIEIPDWEPIEPYEPPPFDYDPPELPPELMEPPPPSPP
jgi:hypothetical protein